MSRETESPNLWIHHHGSRLMDYYPEWGIIGGDGLETNVSDELVDGFMSFWFSFPDKLLMSFLPRFSFAYIC